MQLVKIQSLAIAFPRTVRTNDYWREKFPDAIAPTRQRQSQSPPSLDLIPTASGIDLWLQEVTPYLADPFRGSVERRVIAAAESSVMLEAQAAREAIAAAGLTIAEIDLAIVSSLFPSAVGPGSASHLSQALGLQCPAWNLESTCASALIALQTAQALIQTGVYRHILIVASQIGSQAVNEADTLSWSMGDGAGAMVLGATTDRGEILSTIVLPTIATSGAYTHQLTIDDRGCPRLQTSTGENVSSLAETAADTVRECCQAAVAAAGVSLDRIDYFAFNTPTAWYARVCAKALGIDPHKVIDLYPLYANIGAVFPIANLYHGVATSKIRSGDLVLVYANGAGATAAAMVLRWGEVALGSGESQLGEIGAGATAVSIASSDRGVNSDIQILPQLLAVRPHERYPLLEAYLISSLAPLCQISPTDLDPQVVLTTILDSLIATIWRAQLETNLKVRVPMAQFLGNCNLHQLAEFLLAQIAIASMMQEESDGAEDREVFSL
jgi:3-oxoacyl-[acyl-carrier-protein] synthase III